MSRRGLSLLKDRKGRTAFDTPHFPFIKERKRSFSYSSILIRIRNFAPINDDYKWLINISHTKK